MKLAEALKYTSIETMDFPTKSPAALADKLRITTESVRHERERARHESQSRAAVRLSNRRQPPPNSYKDAEFLLRYIGKKAQAR